MGEQFRIEKKESFRVVGYSLDTTNKRKEGYKLVPLHWGKYKEEKRYEILMPLMNKEAYGVFGVNIYNIDESDSRRFRYMIAVSSQSEISEGLDTYVVPAMTWAIFPCTPETIGKTEVQAITKWLPRSKYKPLNSGYITGRMKGQAPDIEYYGKDNEVEVWVAVKEK